MEEITIRINGERKRGAKKTKSPSYSQAGISRIVILERDCWCRRVLEIGGCFGVDIGMYLLRLILQCVGRQRSLVNYNVWVIVCGCCVVMVGLEYFFCSLYVMETLMLQGGQKEASNGNCRVQNERKEEEFNWFDVALSQFDSLLNFHFFIREMAL
jgi:hypothetical protein